MLPLKYRLPLENRGKFNGVAAKFPTFTLVSRANQLTHPRLAVIVPKAVIKLSTQRHRLVRQLHGLFIKEISLLPPRDILIIAKSSSSPSVLADFQAFIQSSSTLPEQSRKINHKL